LTKNNKTELSYRKISTALNDIEIKKAA